MSLRMEKVNRQLLKLITDVVRHDVDDPLVDFLSITRVDTTSDLRESRVYFSLLDETQYERAREILDKMHKFIRVQLGKKIRMKFLPDIKFVPDTSIKYSVDICRKIEEVRRQEEE